MARVMKVEAVRLADEAGRGLKLLMVDWHYPNQLFASLMKQGRGFLKPVQRISNHLHDARPFASLMKRGVG